MSRSLFIPLALSLTAILSGCGQLTVRVDVLDPDHVRNELFDERLRKLYRETVAAQPGDFAASLDAQAKAYVVAMGKLVRQCDELGQKLGGPPGHGLRSVAQAIATALNDGTNTAGRCPGVC